MATKKKPSPLKGTKVAYDEDGKRLPPNKKKKAAPVVEPAMPKRKKARVHAGGRPAMPEDEKRQRVQLFITPETLELADKVAARQSRNTGVSVRLSTMLATMLDNWAKRQAAKG